MEARDIQTEFVGPIGKDDGKRYKTQTLETDFKKTALVLFWGVFRGKFLLIKN